MGVIVDVCDEMVNLYLSKYVARTINGLSCKVFFIICQYLMIQITVIRSLYSDISEYTFLSSILLFTSDRDLIIQGKH